MRTLTDTLRGLASNEVSTITASSAGAGMFGSMYLLVDDETALIRADADLYGRVMRRLASDGEVVTAERLLGEPNAPQR